MSQDKKFLDWSRFTDPKSAFDLFQESIVDALDFDSYAEKEKFNALALETAYNLTPIEADGYGGVVDASGGDKVQAFIFKARIIDENSPHSFLPDPCFLMDAGHKAAALASIKQHTTFVGYNDAANNGLWVVNTGDIIEVELERGTYSYNLQQGRFIRIVQRGPAKSFDGASCQKLADHFGVMKPMDMNMTGGGRGSLGGLPAGDVVVGGNARATALAAGLPIGDIKAFYSAVITQVGGTPTDEKLKFFGAWGNLEQPRTTNNPLATTHPGKDRNNGGCRPWSADPKMSVFNTACVRNYSTFETGVKATVATLTNGYYPTIVEFIKGTTTAKTAIDALALGEVRKELDRWGSKGYKVYGRLAAGKTDNPNTHISAPA